MPDEIYLQKETDYLFNCSYSSEEFDTDGTEHEYEHFDRAQSLLIKYPLDVVFKAWSYYLYKMCHTEEEAINFCNLFFYYGGSEQLIPEPYRFCGYLYYRIDVDRMLAEGHDEVFYLLDSIATQILQRAHCISLVEDPYYAPERDPKIIEQIKYWQNIDK